MRKNREEDLVADLFRAQGYAVKPEPDGNVPPDLVLNDTIAVEVTRLSKVIELHGSVRSIDNDASSIIAKLKKVINPSNYDKGTGYRYSVTAIIKRPFGNMKKAMSALNAKLKDLDNIETEQKIDVSPTISIIVSDRHLDKPKGFLLTGVIDLDSAYCDQDIMLKSVSMCHELKAKKVSPYLNRYKEWWLVLSDTLTYGDAEEYRDYLRKNICKRPFNKIIIVNSLDGSLGVEI